MFELIAEIFAHLHGAMRYKWWALGFAWVVCLAGWTFVFQMPDEFESSARINVDTRSVLRPLLKGITVEADLSNKVRLMSKLLFSRPNLEKVAQMTDLDLSVTDKAGMAGLTDSIKESLSIEATRENDLFQISAQHPEPKIAQGIVESLLTIFMEEVLGDTREESDNVQRFLDDQIKDYQVRLEEAERRKEEFKRKFFGLLPGQGSDQYSKLQLVSGELQGAKLALREAVKRRDELRRQVEGEEPSFFGFDGESTNATSSFDGRIESLQGRIDDLLLKYTEDHPEVVAATTTLTELKKKKKKEVEEMPKSQRIPNADTNLFYQQMKIGLGDEEAKIASLRTRVAEFQERVNRLQEQMATTLDVETQLKGLNRDYEITKRNYEELVARREKARLSERVEHNTDQVKFRIVDPPRLPRMPSAPNRILINSLIFLGSILFSIGLAVLFAMIRPTFVNAKKLSDETGLPILGSVSMNWLPEIKEQRWTEFLRFCSAFGMLLVAYVAVMVFEVFNMNLHSV